MKQRKTKRKQKLRSTAMQQRCTKQQLTNKKIKAKYL